MDLTLQGSANGLNGHQVAIAGPLGVTTLAVSSGFGDTLGQVLGFTYPG